MFTGIVDQCGTISDVVQAEPTLIIKIMSNYKDLQAHQRMTVADRVYSKFDYLAKITVKHSQLFLGQRLGEQ
ncbi:MAG: hypothetical protein Tsb005_07660 [Gammaproteobacteria bacterium]